MKSKPIVNFEQFIKEFPNIKRKSKKLAEGILPLYPSPKLVEIVAALLTDGHVDWYTSDGYPRPRKILLYSNNKNECQQFIKLCKDLFWINGVVQKYKSKTGYSKRYSYKAIVNNATLARILILAGAPAGDKTELKYQVPNWIMSGNNNIKSIFLNTSFNFDGSVPQKKKDRPCSWQMNYSMNKKKNVIENGIKFLKQIKKLLEEFNIKSGEIGQYRDERDKYTFILSFTNQKSIINFYRKIGFTNPSKQKCLENAVIEIAKKGRIKSKEVQLLLEKLRIKLGGDVKVINEINRYTSQIYSKRELEHFRRGETKIPFEVLFAAIKMGENKEILYKLPDFVNTLRKLYNYRSRFSLIKSSNIFLAKESGY